MSEPRPLTIRRFCLRPLRRKIEVKARARWWLSSRLALTSPLLSAWPRISTPMVSSLSSSLAIRLSGPRVVGNIICGRSGLNEPCTGAVTTRRFSRRSNSKWVPLIASRTFGSYTSNQAWVTAGGGIGTTFGAALSDFSNRLHPLISTHRAMARVLLASIGYPRRDKQKKAGQWPAQTAGHAMLRSSLAELAINNQPIDAQVFADGGPSRRTVLGYWCQNRRLHPVPGRQNQWNRRLQGDQRRADPYRRWRWRPRAGRACNPDRSGFGSAGSCLRPLRVHGSALPATRFPATGHPAGHCRNQPGYGHGRGRCLEGELLAELA